MHPEKVSVVIPARNESSTVGNVVAALRNHPLVDEIIVVDSASSDDTAARASAEGAKVIRLEQAGFGRAVKAGFAAARNAWIFKLDADMTNVSVNWLSLALEQIEPNVGLVKAYWVNEDDPLPMTNLALKPTIKMLIPGLSNIRMPASGIYLCNKSLLIGHVLADDFVFDLELLVRIYRLNYEIKQVDLGIVLDCIKPVSNYIGMAGDLLRFLHQQGKVESSGPLMLVMAHADDAEIWCGGTIAKFLSAGGHVELWIATGDAIREQEAKHLLQIYNNISLNFLRKQEFEHFDNPETVALLSEAITRVRPKTLITHHYSDDHPDHRTCYDLVCGACMKISDDKMPNSIYLCNSYFQNTSSGSGFRANTFINISAEAELKYRLIQQHPSQDPAHWINMARAMDGLNGAKCGASAAEAYEKISFYSAPSAQEYL